MKKTMFFLLSVGLFASEYNCVAITKKFPDGRTYLYKEKTIHKFEDFGKFLSMDKERKIYELLEENNSSKIFKSGNQLIGIPKEKGETINIFKTSVFTGEKEVKTYFCIKLKKAKNEK